MLHNGPLLAVLPAEGLHDALHLQGYVLEQVLDVGRGFPIHLHSVAAPHTCGTGGVSRPRKFFFKILSPENVPNLGQQDRQTSLPQEVIRRETPLSSRANVLQMTQCAHTPADI